MGENSNYILSPLINKICAIKYDLEEVLKSTEFPSEGPPELGRVYLKFLSALIRFFCSIEKNVDKGEINSSVAEEILRPILEELSKKIIPEIRFIRASTKKQTPSAIVYPIEKIVRLISFDTRMIIRPQAAYDYEFRGQVIEELNKFVEQLEETVEIHNLPNISKDSIFKSSPKHIIVINFPQAEKDNIFLHAVIGHEIGHFIFLQKKVSKNLDEVIEENKGKLKKYKNYESLTRTVHRWFKELSSDIFGAHIFGPAFLWALREKILAERHPLDYLPSSPFFVGFPSPRIRFEIISEEVDEYLTFNNLDFSSIGVDRKEQKYMVEKIRDEKKTWDKSLSMGKVELPEGCVFQEYLLREGVKRLRNNLNELIQQYEYKPNCFKNEVLELYLKIKNDISPSEVTTEPGSKKPADWRSTLNAGWLYRLCEMSKPQNPMTVENRFRQDFQDMRFLLKAIETSEIYKQFDEEKQHVGKI